MFVTKEQLFFLDDSVSQNQGVGELPIVLKDKKDSYGYMLFKNRKLIQKYEHKNLCSKIKRVLCIYAVPIKAVCKDDYMGFYKKNVRRIDDTLEIWDGFWKEDVTNTKPYLLLISKAIFNLGFKLIMDLPVCQAFFWMF